MKTEAFRVGNSEIIYYNWGKPDPAEDEVEVEAIYTGVCSSDIAMYCGSFDMLPPEMHGHEGLGIVTRAPEGSVFRKGDYVATRGEPAFSRLYNCKVGNMVKVPEADPKYIIEPIACGVNLGLAPSKILTEYHMVNRIAILGTGALAKIIAQCFDVKHVKVDVYGFAHPEYFEKCGATVRSRTEFWEMMEPTYDVVYDLTGSASNFHAASAVIKDNGVYVLGAPKNAYKDEVTTDFAQFLWKNITIMCPSPRDPNFRDLMADCANVIRYGELDLEGFWTHKYSFENAEQAFTDGINKTTDYGRGYIDFNG